MDIHVKKKDECDLIVYAEMGIKHELSEYFTFKVPGCHFMPAYRNKVWDGKLHVFSIYQSTLPVGLYEDLAAFAEERGYKISFDESVLEYKRNNITREQIVNFIQRLNLPFEARDYQIDAILTSLNRKRLLMLSPTASGKSLIIYTIIRYLNLKTLLIVPTINLVSQMYSDFDNYSINDPSWNVENKCHKIYSGQEKYSECQVTISTWQSLFRLSKEWFDLYDVVIIDEVHLAKAKSLQTIMKKLTRCYYRFGTTGTISDSVTDKMVLKGMFGPVYSATTTKTLMDKGFLAKLKINCVVLKYNEAETKRCKTLLYNEEIDWLVSHHKRNIFIRNLACSMTNNTMVLVKLIRHGETLYQMIKEKLATTNRKCFFVHGGTEGEIREQVRAIVDKEKDAVIVASNVFTTGVNIPNLTTVIFASPTKSRIRTLQSIGRSLRIGDLDYAVLYDIVDDLSHKAHKNFALRHFLERVKLYDSEKFLHKIYNINIAPNQTIF